MRFVEVVLLGLAFLWPVPDVPDGSLLNREAYEFPFASYEKWTQEMAGKGIQDWSKVFGKEEFERFRSGATVRVEKVTYQSEGLAIKGFLVSPAKPKEKVPLVVFNRGGTLEWSRITFWEILEFCRLAERGYGVVASYFRGCGGSEGEDEMGRGDVHDVLNAIQMAEALPFVDTQRMGVWGFSRGAGTSYRLLTQESRIKAAVMVGGVVDALAFHRHAEFAEHVYPKALPGFLENPDAALRTISPLYWAESLNPNAPILLLHGGSDERVLPSQSLAMAGKLQELGRRYRLVIWEGGSHSLLEHVHALRQQLDEWMDTYVRDGRKTMSTSPEPSNPQ